MAEGMPMTAALKKRINALTRLQNEHDTIEDELQEEIRELERKYQSRFQPLYETRAAIVQGKKEPTGDEGILPSDDEDEQNDSEDDEGAEPVKGVPHFWLRALGNCRETEGLIEEHDIPILEHLLDVKVRLLEGDGYQLEFVFSDNPYFSNKSLVKTYESKSEDKSEYLLAKGCEIQWKEGKDVTQTTIKKKQKNKKTGQVRMVTRTEKRASFFHFFNPPEMPDIDEDADEMPEGLEELAEQAQMDLDVGEALKDKVVPQAVAFFLGYGEDEDEDEDYEYDEDDEDDDEDDEDDSGSDKGSDSDDDEPKQPGEKPEECKQQ